MAGFIARVGQDNWSSFIMKIPISSPAAVAAEAGEEEFLGHGVPGEVIGHSWLLHTSTIAQRRRAAIR